MGRLSRSFAIAALFRYHEWRITGGSHAGTGATARHGTRRGVANGIWTLQGREIPGTRCGHWLVRLTNVHGRLSGVVSPARSSVPLQELSLLPDGSFSGTTQAGVVGSTYARAYKVTGKFTEDTVHLTLNHDSGRPFSL